MQPLKRSVLRRHRRYPRRGAAARMVRAGMFASLALLVLVGFGIGLAVIRLSAGPVSIEQVTERLARSMSEQIGPGWSVALRDTSFQMRSGALALHATGLDIRNPEGGLVLRTPEALVSIDGISLFMARLRPRSMEFRDLQLRVVLNSNGSLSFSPGPEALVDNASPAAPPAAAQPAPTAAPAPAVAASAPPEAAERPMPSPVATAIASLFDLLVGSSGLLGILDQAQVTDARLTLVDSSGRDRATFQRVSARFERTDEGGRRFDATLDGPGGTWRLTGAAEPDGRGGYRGTLRGHDAPVQDLLLLSGLSGIPASTDLKVSGEAGATLAGGRVGEVFGRMRSNAGAIRIHDKDTTPLPVDAIALEAAWDEGRRILVLNNVDFRGPATHLVLQGELASPGDPGWNLAVSGRNGVINGVEPGDAPVALDAIEAVASGRDGLVVEKLVLRGPAISVDLAGSFGAGGDAKAIRVDGTATNSSARAILRIWPEAVTPPIRKFFIDSLRAGNVDRMTLAVAMTGQDLERGVAKLAIPDESVQVAFAISEGEFVGAQGLPPLTGATFVGRSGGVKASASVPFARIALPDGRTLNAAAGTMSIASFWGADSAAQIGFRMDGGADALAALIQSPMIKEIGVVEFDPSVVKGRADLKVALTLPFPDIPQIAELPLTVSGTITDLSVDKMFGRDRLEGGNLAIAYDRGALSIKGDGRLGGSPAAIEVVQPRGQQGEATLTATLDDAARARRGIALGSQLTGPVTVKAGVPLGKNTRAGVKVEVDFGRAAVDGLIPGWAKAAGRPGRLAFTYVEKEGSELKDLALDSGATHLRGTVTLSADGQLDRADFTSFKLSSGDDMRVLVERGNGAMRATVRGNVGDARSYTKLLAAPAQRAGAGLRDGKDARDIDLDLALNILTGHNDEAITGVTLKTSLRAGGMRHLQMQGRIGSSPVSAQTEARGSQQIVTLQTANAGSLLRFLDIYRRMSGGTLVLQTGLGEGAQPGNLNLTGFSLKNEPALSKIVPTQSQLLAPEGRSGARTIDVNEVNFTKARADFTRSVGRLEFREAAIWGAEIGFTLDGSVDFGRDKVDVGGTFVPAYALNNFVSNIPLFGPIFSGGRNEGLFGVNFRMSGPIGQPTLTVNPISALAPGITRKFFNAGSGDPNAPPPFTPPER